MQIDDAPRYSTFRDYMQVVRRRKWMIIAIAVLFGLALYLRDHNKARTYTATTKIQYFDQKLNGAEFSAIVPQDISPDARAAMHAQSVATLQVARRAAAALHLPAGDAQGLLNQVSTSVEATTDFVVLSADSTSGAGAARLANAYAGAAVAQAQADLSSQYTRAASALQREIRGLPKQYAYFRALLTNQLQQVKQGANVVQAAAVVQSAKAPTAPSAPKTFRDTVLGFLTGLILALLLAFLLDAFDGRYATAASIGRDLGLPILGVLGHGTLGRTPPPVKGRKALNDADVETFRILRTKIALLDPERRVKIVLVTSAVPAEGKSTVAAALASAFARAGKTTLLLEGDLRAPNMAGRLGLAQSPGLSDALVSATDPRQRFGASGGTGSRALPSGERVSAANGDAVPAAVQGSANGAQPSFDCIVAGTPAPDPPELLGSQQVRTLLAQLRDAYDIVIVDAAPVLPVADTLELLPHADCVLQCLRVSKTPRDHARAAKAVIEELTSAPIGLVLTGVRAKNGYDPYAAYAYSADWSPAGPRWPRPGARSGAGPA